ncbi:ribonuclease P protein component [Rickettsiella endosymbiont of Dermanyssus gallinae]|uniref:ribonuclease P protein component n=1 Tax=Rickettsiella endosymbiont of Dermanyssus gallinae TaxID=2856608 RepID=UPI001C5272C2
MITNNRLFKARRLGNSEDFKQAFQLGKKLRQGCLTTYTKPNDHGYARLGLAIAKKVVSTASARNWVKRTIRESFRLNQGSLPHLDIVITVTSQCLTNKQILQCDLDKQWSRLMIYYKKA